MLKQDKQFTPYMTGKYKEYSKTDNSEKALELCETIENAGALYFENVSAASTDWIRENREFLFEHIDHTFYR